MSGRHVYHREPAMAEQHTSRGVDTFIIGATMPQTREHRHERCGIEITTPIEGDNTRNTAH
jgi:hypothetical protein